jgi:hypothetical protein
MKRLHEWKVNGLTLRELISMLATGEAFPLAATAAAMLNGTISSQQKP